MSADNYGVIAPMSDGRWGIWMGFASDEMPDAELVTARRPYATFDTQDAAEADAFGDYFEYGFSSYDVGETLDGDR